RSAAEPCPELLGGLAHAFNVAQRPEPVGATLGDRVGPSPPAAQLARDALHDRGALGVLFPGYEAHLSARETIEQDVPRPRERRASRVVDAEEQDALEAEAGASERRRAGMVRL